MAKISRGIVLARLLGHTLRRPRHGFSPRFQHRVGNPRISVQQRVLASTASGKPWDADSSATRHICMPEWEKGPAQ
ncbi:hypothetical protein K440DRAFT_632578 [Wilcoxina mikolae CBS 423.85]|nr:hypothetical protein K440DRAFT_632578 [Wilcoxina mikolae CBS 423.85]